MVDELKRGSLNQNGELQCYGNVGSGFNMAKQ